MPIGTNIAAIAYGYTEGNILYDAALPLEDVQAKIHAVGLAYVRAIDFFGLSAKANVVLPYAAGDWEGLYQGIDTFAMRSGMADISFGLAVNFIGSPALAMSEYRDYKQRTIVGGGLQVIAPTGQYDSSKLINLGTNRWSFRPQIGVSHKYKSWYFEFYTNVWLYTENNSFLNGNTLQQKPMVTLKTHVIKSIGSRFWAAVGCGWANGGRSYLNDIRKETIISTIRFGVIGSMALSPQTALKVSAIVAKRIEEGADFDSFSVSYQYVWNTEKG